MYPRLASCLAPIAGKGRLAATSLNATIRCASWRALLAATLLGAMSPALAPQAAAAANPPFALITDVRVAIGSDDNVVCPGGYSRVGIDLNKGSGGDYVYPCVQYGLDPTRGIEELYTNVWFPVDSNPYVHQDCNGDDQAVLGDLNSGVSNGLASHEALYFCIHRPGTNGGSGYELNPGVSMTYFSAPQHKLLTQVDFLYFSADAPPKCTTTACVDAGAGAFSYLEMAATIDQYCQQRDGPTGHPLFRVWEAHDTIAHELSTSVPPDATVFDLNAGSIPVAPYIYACGRYTTADKIDRTPPTASFFNNRPEYTVDQTLDIQCQVDDPAGPNGQDVSGVVRSTCPDTTGPAYTFGLGPHTVTHNVEDAAGNVTTIQTTFDVSVTPTSLGALAEQFLGPTNPILADALATHMNRAAANPAQLQSEVRAFQSLIQAESGFSIATAQVPSAKVLMDLSSVLAPSPRVQPTPRTINDTDPDLLYTGMSWGYYPNRPQLFGDLGNDIHAAMANGDFVLYTFTGTGIAYMSEKSDGYGLIDVYLDGVLQQTVDANAAGVHNQGGQTLFQVSNLPAGHHSLKLVKKSGVYMLVDSFTIQP